MARIKIKTLNDTKAKETKLKFLETIATAAACNTTALYSANDGIIAITASDKDSEILFHPQLMKNLEAAAGFSPVLLPEIKSRRTIICHRVDNLVYENSSNDIGKEIEQTQDWAIIEDVFKFPNPTKKTNNTIKIQFQDAKMAAKAIDQGIKLFNLCVASHQLTNSLSWRPA